MSRTRVVLTKDRPDVDALISELPDLKVGEGYVFDAQDRLLVRIWPSIRITVPGEVERLLETTFEPPLWWTELHAASAPPEAEDIARRCANAFAARHNGTVWAPK